MRGRRRDCKHDALCLEGWLNARAPRGGNISFISTPLERGASYLEGCSFYSFYETVFTHDCKSQDPRRGVKPRLVNVCQIV